MGLVVDLLILYGFYALGFLIGWLLKEKRDNARNVGTKLLIMVVTPIQIFIVLVATTFDPDFSFVFQISITAAGFFTAHTILTFLIIPKFITENKTKGTYFLINAFPNVMFFTIPVILAVFPEHDHLTIVSVIYATVALTIRSSIGSVICQKLGSAEGEKVNSWSILKKIITFPPLVAIILALLVNLLNIRLPLDFFLLIKPAINDVASGLSSLLVGLILAGISRAKLAEYAKKITVGALWRFGISFIMFMGVVYFLKFDTLQTEIRTILLIIVTAPPAVFNVVFADYLKLDEKFAAISVASMTLMSLALLPLLLLFGLWAF